MRQRRPDDPAARQLVELAWNSPDLLMMLDFEGTILAVNPAWTVTLDRDADSFVGRWQDSDGEWRWLSWSLNRDVDVRPGLRRGT